jgi:regulatory protein
VDGGPGEGDAARRRRPGSRRSVESLPTRRERRAAETDPAVVLDAAARFLEARSRSVGETRRRLRSAGYPAALIDTAIARLLDLGILDDAAFARAWVESRDRARPRGEHALSHELALKGLDPATIRETIERRRASAPGPGDAADALETASSIDEAAAQRLLQRRSASLLRVADPRARRARAYALLARNGFDPGVCATVSRRFLAGRASGDNEGDDAGPESG